MYLYRLFGAIGTIIEQTESLARALPSQTWVPEAYLYTCLILAATDDQIADADLRKRNRRVFDRYEKQMKVWADHCPENYLHKYYLIKGERARLGQASLDEVLGWYDKAIQSAKECHLPEQCGPGL